MNGITLSRGAVWVSLWRLSRCPSSCESIATSDYHTSLAVASADGSVVLGSTLLGYHRKRKGVSRSVHRLSTADP